MSLKYARFFLNVACLEYLHPCKASQEWCHNGVVWLLQPLLVGQFPCRWLTHQILVGTTTISKDKPS
jgi:hypothetical protein